eukprot:UN00614
MDKSSRRPKEKMIFFSSTNQKSLVEFSSANLLDITTFRFRLQQGADGWLLDLEFLFLQKSIL